MRVIIWPERSGDEASEEKPLATGPLATKRLGRDVDTRRAMSLHVRRDASKRVGQMPTPLSPRWRIASELLKSTSDMLEYEMRSLSQDLASDLETGYMGNRLDRRHW
jgi:hypothetical protein